MQRSKIAILKFVTLFPIVATRAKGNILVVDTGAAAFIETKSQIGKLLDCARRHAILTLVVAAALDAANKIELA